MTPTAKDATPGKFFCDLCKIGATSQQQLDMHLKGKNHRKNEGKNQPIQPNKKSTHSSALALTPGQVSGAIVRAKLTADSDRRDYSVFRTPSGQFYCSACNLTLNSEAQFVDHAESKRHRKAAAAAAGRKRRAV